MQSLSSAATAPQVLHMWPWARKEKTFVRGELLGLFRASATTYAELNVSEAEGVALEPGRAFVVCGLAWPAVEPSATGRHIELKLSGWLTGPYGRFRNLVWKRVRGAS